MIAPNLILPFNGNNNAIPSGFVRDTRFDGLFFKGSSDDLGGTGGSDNHSHTLNSHTHTIESHAHSGRTQLAWSRQGSKNDDGGNMRYVDNHWHSFDSAGTLGTTATSDTSLTLTASNEPLFYEVIFIKSTGYSLIPNNCAVWSLSNKTNASLLGGGRFIKGAGMGQNAGGTGGSASHSHSINHTHSAPFHTHTITTGGSNFNLGWGRFQDENYIDGHTHTQVLSGAQQQLNQATGTFNLTNSPLSKNLNLWRFSALSLIQTGDIVLTTETTNPTGWVECNGTNNTPDLRGFYVRNNSTYSGTISESGANTHTHENWTHSHTANGTHTHGDGGINNHDHAPKRREDGGTRLCGHKDELHTRGGFNCNSSSANYSSTTATTTAENNEPPYIKVKFLMATSSALGGGGILMLV